MIQVFQVYVINITGSCSLLILQTGILLIVYVFTQPLHMYRMQHKVNFKQNLTGLNSVFLLVEWLPDQI